jgi:neutral ceramidase
MVGMVHPAGTLGDKERMMRTIGLNCAYVLITAVSGLAVGPTAQAADGTEFRVGAADRDITPPAGIPMWGYGARHDMLSQGALDPLMAKAIVIAAGDDKVALVGIDLGRGPTEAMMKTIRQEITAKSGIRNVMITGSHTHHGPVIELTDEPGLGKGKFDVAVSYSQRLPGLFVEAILDADKNLKPARIGVATESVTLNRNRHTKRQPKVTDPMLGVIRFDDLDGKPIAVLVNFAAHPVMTKESVLKYSADYPGFLKNKVEAELATKCIFMQGASGDMSPNPDPGAWEPKSFGEAVAGHVIALARSVKTEVPAHPSVKGRVDTFQFKTRVNLKNPLVVAMFSRAFFPEITRAFAKVYGDGLTAELNTVLINGELALVGGSGEFFCNHANRLKARSYVKYTLFFGYCNGHGMYFPTIEAASEGGYGADAGVSLVELGGGERMMDNALINIYQMMGKFAGEPR